MSKEALNIIGKNIYIVGAKRTPFGSFGGTLAKKTATELAVIASNGVLAYSGVCPTAIDSVIMGNVAQTSSDASYLARHVGLGSGVPIEVPALTVNRLCGSGFQAVINGCHEILLGESKIVLAGGTENMSQSPYAVRNARFGTKLGTNLVMEDTLWSGLTDNYCKMPMAITAEILGEKYNISRVEVDEYSLRSQQNSTAAEEKKIYAQEIIPVDLTIKEATVHFDKDETIRRKCQLSDLSKLPSLFKKGGLVHAGSASGISDGAAALVIASEEAVKTNSLKPMARIVAWSVVGVNPSVMGIGPVMAIRKLLDKTKLTIGDIDMFEINEAFAPQVIACMKELKIPLDRLNVNGGAIALGHPLGCSGARILGHIAHTMITTDNKLAIGSACIGGGQGIAVLLERV